jgi:hypothetical protein
VPKKPKPRALFDRVQQTKPGRIFKPRQAPCYKCSMPGLYHCEAPRCGTPLCLRHRIRKAGGNLCEKHRDAKLVQQDAEPQIRFKDAGEAVPHDEEII